MSAVDLITLGLAASFVGRAVAYLKVFEWLRDPFVSVAKHHCGIGEYNEPKYDSGVLGMIGSLRTCPVCSGMWAGLILALLPNSFSQVLAVGSLAWFVTYVTEAVEWSKCANWEKAGYYRKNTNQTEK